MARLRHANEHRECLLSGTLRKFRFRAVRAVVDLACLKTRRLRFAVEVSRDEARLCSDRLHQAANAQNADHPFQIVGQDV
jgi:hypothetical protein